MPGMASSNTALPLESCIGFNGGVDGGLILEKDGTTIIYPLGSTIIVRQLQNEQQQTFLQGHTDEVSRSLFSLFACELQGFQQQPCISQVSCLVLSPSGRYLASGQLNFMGLKADIIIWDLTTMALMHRMSLHKVSCTCNLARVLLCTLVQDLSAVEATLAGQGPGASFLMR